MYTIQPGEMWTYLRDHWEIRYLTAEACGVGLRARVDVGPAGQQLLDELFGGMILTHDGWNEPSYKTMMFPHDLLEPLVVWALLHDFDVVIRTGGAFYRAMSDDEFRSEETQQFMARNRDSSSKVKYWRKSGTAMNGLQNRHVFSGRVL